MGIESSNSTETTTASFAVNRTPSLNTPNGLSDSTPNLTAITPSLNNSNFSNNGTTKEIESVEVGLGISRADESGIKPRNSMTSIKDQGRLSNSFKKLFIKKKEDSLTLFGDMEDTSEIVSPTSGRFSFRDSSFSVSSTNSSEPNSNRNSCQSNILVGKEDLDSIMYNQDDDNDYYISDDDSGYLNFVNKCHKKQSQPPLRSKKSFLNFRKSLTQISEQNTIEEEVNNPPVGFKTILNVKRQQQESNQLKKIKSVPVLRIPNYSRTDTKVTSPTQTQFRRGSIMENFTRPPSTSISSSSGNSMIFSGPRLSVASNTTTMSRNSVSSQTSQFSQFSQTAGSKN